MRRRPRGGGERGPGCRQGPALLTWPALPAPKGPAPRKQQSGGEKAGGAAPVANNPCASAALSGARRRPRRSVPRGIRSFPPHRPVPLLTLILRPVFIPRRQKRGPHVTALREAESAFLLCVQHKPCWSPPALPLRCPTVSSLGNGPRGRLQWLLPLPTNRAVSLQKSGIGVGFPINFSPVKSDCVHTADAHAPAVPHRAGGGWRKPRSRGCWSPCKFWPTNLKRTISAAPILCVRARGAAPKSPRRRGSRCAGLRAAGGTLFGENRQEETVRTGPGATASKEEQAVKNLNVEHAKQESEKRDEKEQVANKGEPLALPLEAGEYCMPRVNGRRFRVRQPILQYRWDLIQRLGEPPARMREESVDRTGDEMRQLTEKQFSCSLRAVSPDPPHHDHRDEFCLMP
uniref:uncharacterized protein LOC105757295 n=1 Tax=Odobenus rosmarus divergens TaxID=9708 RepID=UPI00063CBA2A|nr:PREDICTED: uncharacterized protein LOC105757295 [Odobenus rosmarus divergens]